MTILANIRMVDKQRARNAFCAKLDTNRSAADRRNQTRASCILRIARPNAAEVTSGPDKWVSGKFYAPQIVEARWRNRPDLEAVVKEKMMAITRLFKDTSIFAFMESRAVAFNPKLFIRKKVTYPFRGKWSIPPICGCLSTRKSRSIRQDFQAPPFPTAMPLGSNVSIAGSWQASRRKNIIAQAGIDGLRPKAYHRAERIVELREAAANETIAATGAVRNSLHCRCHLVRKADWCSDSEQGPEAER